MDPTVSWPVDVSCENMVDSSIRDRLLARPTFSRGGAGGMVRFAAAWPVSTDRALASKRAVLAAWFLASGDDPRWDRRGACPWGGREKASSKKE
jgi:hypothetical protein